MGHVVDVPLACSAAVAPVRRHSQVPGFVDMAFAGFSQSVAELGDHRAPTFVDQVPVDGENDYVGTPDELGEGGLEFVACCIRHGVNPVVTVSGSSWCLAPLTGLEPVHTAPEADALSAELQGLERVRLPDRSMAPPADTGGA